MTFDDFCKVVTGEVQVVVALGETLLETILYNGEDRKNARETLGHLPVMQVCTNKDIGCLRVELAGSGITGPGGR